MKIHPFSGCVYITIAGYPVFSSRFHAYVHDHGFRNDEKKHLVDESAASFATF